MKLFQSAKIILELENEIVLLVANTENRYLTGHEGI